MNSSYDISFESYEDTSKHNFRHKGGINISNELADLCERLRVSALTNAAEISPLVKEVTIGPNSPRKKDDYKDTTPIINKEQPSENLLEDKLQEDLRYLLIAKKCENKMQKTSNELFKDILGNMLCKHAEATTQFWQIQAQECQKRTLLDKERKMKMYKSIQENDNTSLLEKARTNELNCPINNTDTIDNMNKILEEQNKATARFASITDISNQLTAEPLAKTVINTYTGGIGAVKENNNVVTEYCKTGNVPDKDAKQAKLLALNIENIKKNIAQDLEVIKKEEILMKQKQEELKKKQIEEEKAQQIKLAQAAAAEKEKTERMKKTKPVFFSNNNYKYYEDLKNYLDQYEVQYKDLLEDTSLKKFRFDCQKAVNTPVNALSSVSVLHMKDKYDKLSKLLKGEIVQVLDISVRATRHPQGLAYCTALLAKKIVRQGDLLVSSNTEAAYPLAAVTVALWAQFPHFGKLVEAYFHRLCPYLVPMFLPQKEGQTDKEFYLSRGYTYNDEGVVEKQDKFLKRMSGIFRLRCAIWTAKMPKFLNSPHPNGMRHAWHWLASFINLKPEPDISATLLHDFYIMCGSRCNECYDKQFRKILVLANSDYLKILENIDEGGPKTRLEVYLQAALKSNNIPPPPVPAQQINW
ncbi:unnamed protein product [Arctia plantaginis]|uniref:mRNA export factor GLE1 n=1 Tax=Arctia plantaginis TaxID=874455 RepID=A0A8S1AV34_ARCPL|nr:unnamed protein product [Arctia plantaginis]